MTLPVDPSFHGLFAPNRHYDYLSRASERPFRARAGDYDPVNAWWLAELSMLEYVRSRPFKTAVLRRAGLSELRFFDIPRTNTQCMLAGNASLLLLVFRGTELGSLQDLLTDAAVIWRREPGGGRIHQGFKEALDSLWPRLSAWLDSEVRGRALWLAGHSLGGALATLAAHRLGRSVAGLYTFGCPRLGNQAFAAQFDCPAWRLVNNNDIVPRVPPYPYVPVGQLCYLDRNGALHRDADSGLRSEDRWRGHLRHARDVIERWAGGDFSVVFNDDLYDHAPIHYVRLLRGLLDDGGS